MAIRKENIQVTTVIPKELNKQIEEMAKKEYRTKSQQIAKILIEYCETQKDSD